MERFVRTMHFTFSEDGTPAYEELLGIGCACVAAAARGRDYQRRLRAAS
jgi:hypothetical protein